MTEKGRRSWKKSPHKCIGKIVKVDARAKMTHFCALSYFATARCAVSTLITSFSMALPLGHEGLTRAFELKLSNSVD